MAEEMEKDRREEEGAEEDVMLKPRQRSKNKADEYNIGGEDKERAINGGGDENSAINGEGKMMDGALTAEKNEEDNEKIIEAPVEDENEEQGDGKINNELLKLEDRTRSIHLDEDEGPAPSNDVPANSFMKVQNLDAGGSLVNGRVHATATEPNFQDDLHVEGKDNNSKIISIEDTAEPPPEIYSEDQITSVEPATASNEGVIIVNKTRSDITEFDVERVLEEQDTHDLYCPNCNSCITKRVILRKRKRTVKHLPYDMKRGRLTDVGGHDASSSLTGTEHFNANEPEVFRCLSCFSFFIPSDRGFSIFRVFGKREQNMSLQTSQVIPSKNSNWYSLIFRRTTDAKKGNDIEAPLLGEHSGKEEIHSSEPSNHNISTTTSGFMMSGASQTESLDFVNDIVKNKPAGEPIVGHLSKAEHMAVKNEGMTSTQITSASEVSVNAAGSQSNIAMEQSGAKVPEIPNQSFTEQMEDLDQKVISSIISTASKPLPDKGQDIVPSKLNDTSKYDTDRYAGPPKEDLAGALINPSTGQAVVPQGVEPDGEPRPEISETPDTCLDIDEPATETTREWEILKSIVYGGLVESITSLSVISSAAGADAATLNIVALGLANLIGGLFIVSHDLSALKNEQQESTTPEEQRRGRYWELLGRRENFILHAILAVLSYIIFGLLPPMIYGFSFYKSDNKEYKLMVVAGVALICISLLALAKAHVGTGSTYFRTVVYYLGLGFAASGLSYVVGVLINRLLERIGLFNQGGETSTPASFALLGSSSSSISWSSY